MVNRRSRHTFEENEEVDDVNGNGDYLVDEFMVLDASKTKYGMGGEEFHSPVIHLCGNMISKVHLSISIYQNQQREKSSCYTYC